MNIEHLATNEIDEAISRTELLDPVINKDDKEPTWDGFIYAYKNKYKRKKEMFGRAPFQVKGTVRNPRKKSVITYTVNYADLNNFRNDGGALYFVVYISPDYEKEIYYAALLPRNLNELLEKQNGKKTHALSLQAFPKDAKDIEDIVVNFIQNCQLQASPTRKNWSLEELSNTFGLEQIQIKLHFTDVYKHKDPTDYLFNHYTEMYVPVGLTKQEYPIGPSKLESIETTIDAPVIAGGVQYYSSYTAGRNKDGYIISIGEGLLRIINAEDKTTFRFNISGDLPTQIEQAEFLLAMFDSGELKLGETTHYIDIDSLSEKERIDELRAKHEWNLDLQNTLNILGVKEALKFDGWNKADAFYSTQLIKAVLYHETVELPDKLNPMSIINIRNISVGVLCIKTSSGHYKLENMFGDELQIFMVIDDQQVLTSQYVVLKKNDIRKLSNIDYNIIENSVKQFNSDEHYDVVNLLALEMLLAYDESKNTELLEAIIRITEWLHQSSPKNNAFLLNWYQALLRKNSQDARINKERLRYLIENEDDEIKAGAAIIAGDKELAQTILGNLPKDKKDLFMEYPIVNLI